MKKIKIWVLIDNIPGNSNQSLALAHNLNLSFEIKQFKYNKFSFLPSFITSGSLIGIKNPEIIFGNLPDIVISCGRRMANIARYIKKNNPATKLIQILWPEFGIRDFDLIILPSHDGYKDHYKNIVRIEGALSKINPLMLQEEKNKWNRDNFQLVEPPYISLLIGGNTKRGKFTKFHANELLKKANEMAKENNTSLLISTSRRTDNEIIEEIDRIIEVPYFFHNYLTVGPNPYLGFLSMADKIIVTGDSVSMCVDACSSGKNVYIYENDDFIPKKHQRFLASLFANNYARSLTGKEDQKFYKETKTLNNLPQITDIILNRFIC